jgi:hypothetical protein
VAFNRVLGDLSSSTVNRYPTLSLDNATFFSKLPYYLPVLRICPINPTFPSLSVNGPVAPPADESSRDRSIETRLPVLQSKEESGSRNHGDNIMTSTSSSAIVEENRIVTLLCRDVLDILEQDLSSTGSVRRSIAGKIHSHFLV